MKTKILLLILLLNVAAGAGCRLFRPTEDPIRYYTLASPGTREGAVGGSTGATEAGKVVVGVGAVILPGYLMRDSVVVRQSPNEVVYRSFDRWADRLDRSLQRVLVADLMGRLGPGGVRSNAWRREEVRCELYVTVIRFEFDESGRVVLEANWRLTDPGEGREILARSTRIEKAGPAPGRDMPGAVGALGEAAAGLNGEIAEAIRGLGS